MWTNDASGKMTGEQPGWSGLTRQSRAEYEGYGWSTAVHAEDAEPTLTAWNTAVAERREFKFEHRVRRFDGAWRICEIKAVPVMDDTGIGIPDEALNQVFDMFNQVDTHRPQAQGGLGIGLALVRTLVQLHGGTVNAFSAGQGLGSTFVVRLPMILGTVESDAAAQTLEV